jgi:hypothetical protein
VQCGRTVRKTIDWLIATFCKKDLIDCLLKRSASWIIQ